jgi:hypothetical protein
LNYFSFHFKGTVVGTCSSDSPNAVPDTQCTPSDDDISWRVGRIVELDTLVDNLKTGCVTCGDVLGITDIVGEKKFGLGQVHLYCMLV